MERVNMAMVKAYCVAMSAVDGMKKRAKNFMTEERGAADFIAVIIILAIVVALCVVFRKQIFKLFDSIWGNVDSEVSAANEGYSGAYKD